MILLEVLLFVVMQYASDHCDETIRDNIRRDRVCLSSAICTQQGSNSGLMATIRDKDRIGYSNIWVEKQ